MSYGMCPHNNIKTYCPSCIAGVGMGRSRGLQAAEGGQGQRKEFAMRGRSSMGIYPQMNGMGDLNLNLPSLSQILSSAEVGVEQQVAANLAQSQSVQSAAQTAAGNALGTNIMNFYTQNPALAWTLTAGVALFVIYGLMSFAKPK